MRAVSVRPFSRNLSCPDNFSLQSSGRPPASVGVKSRKISSTLTVIMLIVKILMAVTIMIRTMKITMATTSQTIRQLLSRKQKMHLGLMIQNCDKNLKNS